MVVSEYLIHAKVRVISLYFLSDSACLISVEDKEYTRKITCITIF